MRNIRIGINGGEEISDRLPSGQYTLRLTSVAYCLVSLMVVWICLLLVLFVGIWLEAPCPNIWKSKFARNALPCSLIC